MTGLTFYTNPMSRGRIVRWMLEEVGEPYETVVLGYGAEMKAAAYLAVNPMGKVPALRHGEAVVTEAGAICAYLAEAFPGAGLSPPPGSPGRAAFLRWMFFAAGPVEAAVTDRSFGWAASGPQEERRLGYGSLERVADALAGQLGSGPFLLGETFSAVDVYLGSQIMWGRMFDTLPERPPFAEYVERLRARPAAIRANEKDDALAPEGEGA